MDNLIKFAIKQPIAVAAMVFLIIAFGFVSLTSAQDLYNRAGQANLIQVRATEPEIAESVAKRIQDQVKFPGGGLKSVPLTDTWMKQYTPLFDAMKLEKIVTMIVQALIILVADFNIASTLIMMVMEIRIYTR